MGDAKAAREHFNKAYALGPTFQELAIYAAAGNIAAGDKVAADTILTDAYGTTAVDSDILAAAYYRTNDWSRLIGMLTARANRPGAGADAWFALAAAYYTAGDKASALKTINTAVARYPDAAAAGAEAIKQIKGR
jgi:tetratricopeptide (TPR) repeat protein